MDDPDSDSDGLNDKEEKEHYTDPMEYDTDFDGLSDSQDTMNPLTNLSITFNIKEILQLDPVDDGSGSDIDKDNTDGDFYVKISMDANGEITWKSTPIPIEKDNGDITTLQKLVFPVKDNIEQVTFTVYLYDDDSGTGEACDISPSNNYYATLYYSLKNSTWWGDDHIGDSNNYGTMSGNEDGSTSIDENDCRIRFNITSGDIDKDKLVYWEEVNIYHSSPINYTKNWLFMVYMDGDNNLEDWLIGDVNEMEEVGSTPLLNVVVQLDRWDGMFEGEYQREDDTSNGNWTGTRRYYIIKDNDSKTIDSPVVRDLGETDMGDPKTLKDFVIWATSNYPKTNTYVLTLSDHGSPSDICIDASSGNSISYSELKWALKSIKNFTAKNIDIIGFYACEYQNIENLYEIQDSVNIAMGSAPGFAAGAWPYMIFLETISQNSNISPKKLAYTVIEKYGDALNYIEGYDLALSAYDLTLLKKYLIPSVDNFSKALIDCITPQIKRDIQNLTAGPWPETESWTGKGGSRYYDLYDFANDVYREVDNFTIKSNAQRVMYSINISLINEFHGHAFQDSVRGLSIFLGANVSGEPSYVVDRYINRDFAIDTHWDEFLDAYWGE